jgi:uncharacterized membrane protein YtjA (UPF0391 family)
MIVMLRWALTFFVLALVAAMFAFSGGLAATSAGVARSLFFAFLIVFVVSLVFGLTATRRRSMI